MAKHSPFRQFLGEIDPFGPVFRSKKQPRLRSYLANMDLGGFGPINPHSFREHTLFRFFLTFSHLKEAPVLISSLVQFFGIWSWDESASTYCGENSIYSVFYCKTMYFFKNLNST